MKNISNKKILFIFCGCINTAFSSATFYFLFPVLLKFISHYLIIFLHFNLVCIFNFYCYNKVIYKIKNSLLKSLINFYLSNILIGLISIILFDILFSYFLINYFISFIIVSFVVAVWTYILNDGFVFKQQTKI